MTLAIANLKYASSDNALIDMDVSGWNNLPTFPFTYHAGDTSALSVAVNPLISGQTIAAYVAPVLVPVVPPTISDRQFFQQLAIQGVITQADALAAVKTGTLPAALAALVAALPPDQQFGANMLLSGATSFQRSHPLTSTLGAAFGWTSAQIDAFWTAAAAL